MYRTICTELWSDPEIRELPALGKLLFVYLITNPHTHLSGIYYLPSLLMVKETSIPKPIPYLNTLSRLEKAHYDDRTETIFVTKMFSYQGKGEKNERAAARHLTTLHHSSLILKFISCYPEVKPFLPIPYLDTLSDLEKRCPSVSVPNSVPNSSSGSDLKSKSHDEDFEHFWSLYPRKIGKGHARKVWSKLHPVNGLTERICIQVQAASLTEQWTKEGGKYIPHPSTWLNESRWEDDYTIQSRHATGLNVVAFLKGGST